MGTTLAVSKVEHAFNLPAMSGPAIVDRCAKTLSDLGWNVARPSQTTCSGTRGSQIRARLLGTWALRVRPKDLPQQVAVEASATGLHITLRDRVGVGVLDQRTKDKYAVAFAETEEALRAALS